MGNAYGPREWKLDTTGTITVDKVRVRGMEFIPNAASDDVVIKNAAGDTIWAVTNALSGGVAGIETINFGDKGHDVEGFVLNSLGTSCVLNVWLV